MTDGEVINGVVIAGGRKHGVGEIVKNLSPQDLARLTATGHLRPIAAKPEEPVEPSNVVADDQVEPDEPVQKRKHTKFPKADEIPSD